MSETISTREMAEHDFEVVAHLATQLGYASTKQQIASRFFRLSQDANQALMVAELGKEVIGWVQVREHLSIVTDGRAEIAALVVDEKYRSKGVGQLLMKQAEKWATDNGFTKMRVSSNIIRNEAHRFYAKLGYESKKTSHIFVKDLHP